jgi:hypothetical protein
MKKVNVKLKVKLMYSANENKILNTTLPGKCIRKVLDYPQVQGIVVANFNVKVWGIIPEEKVKLLFSQITVTNLVFYVQKTKETIENDLMIENKMQ